MNYIYYLFIITLIFIIYIEYSVGGILFRPNGMGVMSMNISSMMNFLIHPLKSLFLWNKNLLDTNYIFVIIISSLFYLIYYNVRRR